MKRYNLVLFGGSNSVIVDGLQKGLKQPNIKLTNLALGACGTMQNLYELNRSKNQAVINEADFIITEGNINDVATWHVPQEAVANSIEWFYAGLYGRKKKVIILLLPREWSREKDVNNLHRMCAVKYGFNIIDMQTHYERLDVLEFYETNDSAHQLFSIMSHIAETIVDNLKYFRSPKELQLVNDVLPEFKIITPKDMKNVGGGGITETVSSKLRFQ